MSVAEFFWVSSIQIIGPLEGRNHDVVAEVLQVWNGYHLRGIADFIFRIG